MAKREMFSEKDQARAYQFGWDAAKIGKKLTNDDWMLKRTKDVKSYWKGFMDYIRSSMKHDQAA